jgi:cell wall-associated NlpC family hydrolase
VSVSGAVGIGIRIGQWLNGDGFKNYEHAFIYIGAGQIVEAEPGGARVAQLDEYRGRKIAWSTITLTDPQRARVVMEARVQASNKVGYSYLDYLAIAAHRFHLPIPGLRSYIANSGHQICSQLVDWCWNKADVHLFRDNRWEGYVDPEELVQFTR